MTVLEWETAPQRTAIRTDDIYDTHQHQHLSKSYNLYYSIIFISLLFLCPYRRHYEP